MKTKLERFDALDKVIINLETEAEKLGSFSRLVAQVGTINKDLEALLDRQNSCQHELQTLTAASGEPVQKIQELTKQLDREIKQVNCKQSAFNESLKENQTEQFNALLDRQSSITKTLSIQVEQIGEKIKTSCHDDLEQIIKSSEEPLQNIKALAAQLQVEISELNAQQSGFYDRQQAVQEVYFQDFLARQEAASEKLQDGIQAITLGVKKIDPDLLEEMRVVYQESQSELTRIRNLLEQMTDAQHKQKNQLQDLQSKLTDHEKSINQRFTKLDLSAEKIRHLPEALEQLKTQLQETAEESRQYRKTETEHQKEIANTLNTLSKFSAFSKLAFLGLAVLIIISFFVGA